VVSYEHFIFLLIFGYFLLTKLKSLGDFKALPCFFLFYGRRVRLCYGDSLLYCAFVFLILHWSFFYRSFNPCCHCFGQLNFKEPIAPKFLLWASVCLIGGLFIGHNEVSYLLSNEVDTSSETAAFGYLFGFYRRFWLGCLHSFWQEAHFTWLCRARYYAWALLFCGLTLAPFFFLYAEPLTIPWDSFFKIGLMVLISGILALFLYYQGLKRVSARSAALAEMFFPLCAVIVNWIFLGKGLTPMQILGE
jgi:drug/metabolite transporter (DMT)-like permease